MYRYAALIICIFGLVCIGCDEETSPPPKPKIVHKKISQKPVVKAETADTTSPEAEPDENIPTVGSADESKVSGDAAPLKVASDAIIVGLQDGEAGGGGQSVEDGSVLGDRELQAILKRADGDGKAALKTTSGYTAGNRIDPFEPLFKPKPVEKPKPAAEVKEKEKPPVPTRRLTPLEKVDLDQLRLVGIVRADSGNKALVEDASGKGYIVVHGTYMGIHSGKVVDILKDRIIVEENDEDLLGNVRVHKRELKFQRPSGDEYYEM